MFRLPSLAHRAILAALTAASLAAASPAARASSQPEQLIVVSFDGAHDNRLWEKSLALAERTGARFTYFLSCTFLMSKAEARAYQAPGHGKGRSNIGFAPDEADIAVRLGHVWSAVQAGHEIGSHGCGHFDGENWSKSDWLKEFVQFDRALKDAWRANDLREAEPAGWQDFARTGVKGFRAPYLAAGEDLYKALAAHGFSLDASSVSRGPVAPDVKESVARFSLPLVPEGPQSRRVIAMDYNLFVRHSGGKDELPKSAEFEERALEAFRAAFDEQYSGERAPLQLGFHFVEMNGGAYWRALERFLDESCRKPGVACVSYEAALSDIRNSSGARPAS